jgi:primase-polymerase (primpol)-like protein
MHPEPLKHFPQWVNWRIEPNGKKALLNPRTGQYASVSDSTTWTDYNTAVATGQNVGFVFTTNDPFFFIDVDKAYADGQWSQLATELCQTFPGAFVEVSQSGTGLHIIGTSRQMAHSCKNIPLGIELYTESRFCALTGLHAVGNAMTDCSEALAGVIARYFPASSSSGSLEWTTEPCEGSSPIRSNDKLIEKACKTQSASSFFGGTCSFADLWYGNVDALSVAYPDPSGQRDYDASSADAALAQHLAFWTGKNCERIKTLMQDSALVRDKWNREDYLYRTIISAVARQSAVYTGGKTNEPSAPPPAESMPDGVTYASGYQYLTVDAQLEHFAGCVYVKDIHRIFTPDGSLLNQERFNAVYGGYVFQIDSMNDKTTKRAWEAFTESQALRRPKAGSTCFRPDIESGKIVQFGLETRVNIYVPEPVKRVQGDPTPFITHVRKILPDPNDQAIMFAYMAACVQYKGVKFQWAPLIQGVEGNGKSLLSRCVAEAIGDRYTHWPKVKEISEKFNEWLFNKVLICMEDVYWPEERREIIEVLKPMITNDKLAMRAMQQAEVMRDNRANFILNSNHRDAIRKTESDRRFAVFYCPQQALTDLKRDGMDGEYFPRLYEWLKYQDGYAIVTDFLHRYEIPDALNPATSCHRAPLTSTTAEAIAASEGSVEQEIREAIAEERLGFAGGWVSSVALDRLLQMMRAGRMIPPNKRKQLMEDMGYIHHPALKDGRVNSPIGIDDNKKPRLFIQRGHLAANLSAPTQVVEAYLKAQGVAVNAMAEARFGG